MQTKNVFGKFIEEVSAETKDLLFEELLYSDLVGVNITDRRGQTIFLNDAHTRITGQPKELYLNHTMIELEETGMVTPSAVVQALSTKKPVLVQQTVSTGRSFEVRGTPIFNKEGKLILILCLLTDITDIVQSRKTIEEIQEYVADLKEAITGEGRLIYQSPAMRSLVERAKKIATTDVSVLITGPSGVGKEMLADIIQENGPRREKPYIKINCAAIPETLLESELFGYEPGAFTGGNPKGKKGLIEAANGGTLLLDEIGDLPLMLQSKLLRTLQSRTIRHLGGTQDIDVDFKLICATNADLMEKVKTKAFRDDLYYRINVIDLTVPPLDSRKQDIPLLINHFIKLFNARYEMDKGIAPDAVQYLTKYNYPGNVRELRNIVERLIIQSPGTEITLKDVYESIGSFAGALPESIMAPLSVAEVEGRSLKEIMEVYEKALLQEYSKVCKNGTEMARRLKTDQSTMSRKLSKYGIHGSVK